MNMNGFLIMNGASQKRWMKNIFTLLNSRSVKIIVLAFTFSFIIISRATMLPEDRWDIWEGQIHESPGKDFVADNYTAKVVTNDWTDMYVKEGVNQTENEAKTWTKEQSSPYPPLTIIVYGPLKFIGDSTGLGFYGSMVLMELLLMVAIFIYCIRTKWYLFPLIYLNPFIAYRFWWVGDLSNVLMLLVIMGALFLSTNKGPLKHIAVAVATGMKFAPIYYMKNLFKMKTNR